MLCSLPIHGTLQGKFMPSRLGMYYKIAPLFGLVGARPPWTRALSAPSIRLRSICSELPLGWDMIQKLSAHMKLHICVTIFCHNLGASKLSWRRHRLNEKLLFRRIRTLLGIWSIWKMPMNEKEMEIETVKPVQTASKLEVGYSQVSRQGKRCDSRGKLVHGATPKNNVIREHLLTRAGCDSNTRVSNMKYMNHQIHGLRSSSSCKIKLGITAGYSNFPNGSI